MTRQCPDLGSASHWLKQISHAERPIRNTTQIWVVTRHQYGISALVSQTSFRRETVVGVARCRLFSQAAIMQATYANAPATQTTAHMLKRNGRETSTSRTLQLKFLLYLSGMGVDLFFDTLTHPNPSRFIYQTVNVPIKETVGPSTGLWALPKHTFSCDWLGQMTTFFCNKDGDR